MPKYVIERELPGVGRLDEQEISTISQKSNGILADLGDVQWLQSYITPDKLYCMYIAPDEERLREHATRGGFPIDSVRQVMRVIDATSGGI